MTGHWRMRRFIRQRIVFNWHNFLSGCTGWDLEDWQKWIDQSVKMRYNTIMVHAYGNNPMVQFVFNGQEKPLGYLTTTISGRDWGAQHVNDVRKVVSGDRSSHNRFSVARRLWSMSRKEGRQLPN